uniref:Uncharacterized protein n=1 Tax=Tetranychus urticae TaxID=32264 RepID=T1L3A4_TETUR
MNTYKMMLMILMKLMKLMKIKMWMKMKMANEDVSGLNTFVWMRSLNKHVTCHQNVKRYPICIVTPCSVG